MWALYASKQKKRTLKETTKMLSSRRNESYRALRLRIYKYNKYYARDETREKRKSTTHHWVNPTLNPRLASSLSSRYLSPSRCDRESSSNIEARLSDHREGLSLCRICQTVSSIGPRGGSTSRRRWSRLTRRTVVDLLLLQPWYSFLNTFKSQFRSRSSLLVSIPFSLRMKNTKKRRVKQIKKTEKKRKKRGVKQRKPLSIETTKLSLEGLSFLCFVPSKKQRQSDFCVQ